MMVKTEALATARWGEGDNAEFTAVRCPSLRRRPPIESRCHHGPLLLATRQAASACRYSRGHPTSRPRREPRKRAVLLLVARAAVAAAVAVPNLHRERPAPG